MDESVKELVFHITILLIVVLVGTGVIFGINLLQQLDPNRITPTEKVSMSVNILENLKNQFKAGKIMTCGAGGYRA